MNQNHTPHQEATATGPSAADLFDFTDAIHGDQHGLLALFSGKRVPGVQKLQDPQYEFFVYPTLVPDAAKWIRAQARAGRETYICAHLVLDRRRKKESAAPVGSLWCDQDNDRRLASTPATMIVASSPGRFQSYWKLDRPVEPARAEVLNKRLALALGADPSGFDLTQLLRPPQTINFKYADRPTVEMVEHDPSRVYDPDHLDRVLPPLPATPPRPEPTATGAGVDLEPPVPLVGEALAAWRGERPVAKRDGSGQVDRSDSLWRIGAELRDAGLAPRLIAAELAERDATLGWGCYADRPAEYDRMAAKLAAKGRTPRATIVTNRPGPDDAGDAPDADPCEEIRDDVAALRAENATLRRRVGELEAEVRELKRTQSAIIATVTNPHLKAEAATIVRLVNDVHRRRQNGERPDARGFLRARPADLGEDYPDRADLPKLDKIRGKATVNRHLQNLADAGLIERELRPDTIEKVAVDPVTKRAIIDPATGQPVRERIRTQTTWVRLTGDSLADAPDPFARWRRPEPAAGEEQPKTHGGKRERRLVPPCPECGSTDTAAVAVACHSCGALSDLLAADQAAEEASTFQDETAGAAPDHPDHGPRPGNDPTAFQDETVEENAAYTPPPTVGNSTAFQDETRFQSRAEQRPERRSGLVLPPLRAPRAPAGRVCVERDCGVPLPPGHPGHYCVEHGGGTYGARPFAGMEPVPPDRWTDATIRGRP